MGLRVLILSGSARSTDSSIYGLKQDAKLVEQVLRETNASGTTKIDVIEHYDPVTFYGGSQKRILADIIIHLEVPCRAAWKWGRLHVVVVNPEWWPKSAWNWVCLPPEKHGADFFIFKSNYARRLFPEVDDKRARIVTWRAGTDIQSAMNTLGVPAKNEFLYLVGSSSNKMAAAILICKSWRSTWPPLTVVGADHVINTIERAAPRSGTMGVTFLPPFKLESERIAIQTSYKYHVVASIAEGFGYTFAEAALLGAIPLWTNIGVYEELWSSVLGEIGNIHTSFHAESDYRDIPAIFKENNVVHAVESILKLSTDDEKNLRGALRHLASTRSKEFRHGWRSLLNLCKSRLTTIPTPTIMPYPTSYGELPNVAIITLTRNRPRWFANMVKNILAIDYPPDKLSWVVADDGDSEKRIDSHVMKFMSKNPRIHTKYLSLPKPLPVGEKRNRACLYSPNDAQVFMMMDDDDHYPPESVRYRIDWLLGTKSECVYCSTIPMYDCKRYISAINVPPLNLAPAERVSEATLCFTRDFFTKGKFPSGVSIAEGEGFLAGREYQATEIPPDKIIVSFIHGENVSARRIPAENEANGCHYGFDDDFFTYISELAV
jgi:hypothetical protein